MSDRLWSPIFLPDDIPRPVGAYSPGVRAGDFLYVSGQVPRDPRSGALIGATVEEQARQVIANLTAVLHAGGATLADVVSTVIYLENEQDWPIVNEFWKTAFPVPYPSRTTVGARLRGILIEVSAVAYLPGR
jgi:2-iminobutanoate/2-iminopropanoate deaminase